jgi:hypothetical protein
LVGFLRGPLTNHDTPPALQLPGRIQFAPKTHFSSVEHWISQQQLYLGRVEWSSGWRCDLQTGRITPFGIGKSAPERHPARGHLLQGSF